MQKTKVFMLHDELVISQIKIDENLSRLLDKLHHSSLTKKGFTVHHCNAQPHKNITTICQKKM